MGHPIRPSNVRVYQFHHDGMSLSSSWRERAGPASGAAGAGAFAARRGPGRRLTPSQSPAAG